MKDFLKNLPWQDIANWVAGVGIPALLAIWRQQAVRQGKTLTAVVQGVEESTSKMEGNTGCLVKQAIQAKATQAGVDQHLANVVDKATTPPEGKQ